MLRYHQRVTREALDEGEGVEIWFEAQPSAWIGPDGPCTCALPERRAEEEHGAFVWVQGALSESGLEEVER